MATFKGSRLEGVHCIAGGVIFRSLQRINSEVQLVNGKLVHLAALYPDVASLSPLDYDTSKRADPEVLHKLITHAKHLRVSGDHFLVGLNFAQCIKVPLSILL